MVGRTIEGRPDCRWLLRAPVAVGSSSTDRLYPKRNGPLDLRQSTEADLLAEATTTDSPQQPPTVRPYLSSGRSALSITIRSTGPRAGCSLSQSCSWIAVKKSGRSEGAWPAGLAGAHRR